VIQVQPLDGRFPGPVRGPRGWRCADLVRALGRAPL